MADDNFLGSLIGSIILQIKPYELPKFSGNGKSEAGAKNILELKIGESERKEIEAQIGAKMAANPGMERMKAIEAVFADRRAAAGKKEEHHLPRNGMFRWLRRNGNGGEAAKQAPAAMKK